MHPKPDVLRALVDGELSADRAEQVREHLSRCPACQDQFRSLQTRTHQAASALAALAPRGEESPRPAYLAFARLSGGTRKTNSQKENIFPMLKHKPLWTAIAVVAVLAVALSLTPVRAWASEFLSLFRVEKIAVVQFDPRAARQMEEKMSGLEETASSLLEQNLEVTQEGEMRGVATVDEAAAAAGFMPRIPAGMENVKLAYHPGAQVTLTIDREPMQAILDALEADVQLAEDVDGKAVTAVSQGSVVAASGCDPTMTDDEIPQECTVLVQMPSPTVDAPASLDVQKIGAAGFQLLGYSPEEAAQLSQRIDWTSTLLLPVPKDGDIAVHELTVDGVTGTLLIDEDENSYALLWLKDGIFYVLRGPGWASEAESMAATLP